MRDVYRSIPQLMAVEGAHISILAATHGRSRVAILAPHAGRIEPMTGEIALAIAGREHRVYCFLGQAPARNSRLHVTSTRFDEASLREVLRGSTTVLTVHGAAGCGRAVTYIGGRNASMAQRMGARLAAAGFHVEEPPPRLAGQSLRNIVNWTSSGGVQLELSWELRQRFKGELSERGVPSHPEGRPGLRNFVEAVRSVLAEAQYEHGAEAER